MKTRKLFAALGMVCAVLMGAGVVGVPQASAATANAGAWVVAPQWWGWCPGGAANRPLQVQVTNYTAGTAKFSSWNGTDKIHIAVVNGRTNQVQVSVLCSRSSWQSSGGYHFLSVDRSERTFFVGADGGVSRQ